ncbi:hypothetical protein GUJ93_ZPchr0013g36854 [Zizania palustris]|uniref:Oberon PHD finger domain-containing protein n=1 Tax=Zizania palustris TaxID=103762 RepID=A0A8J5X284_ZIZPA|nr:hypothetical protein GUJ93_ZPchr0013g36854 [Zizania palustris]
MDPFERTGTQQVGLHEPKCGLADPAGPCKARNNLCKLEREGFIESSPAHDCVICSRNPGFCRECCCIFCRRVVDYSFGGYSYIKCEAVLEENYICGHVAHLECAHRSFMVGTVGGSIDLDVQYLCRLCDNKTNLMMHVEELLETCKSLQSRDEIEPILITGSYLLRGSGQMKARSLAKYVRSAMAKLKRGVDLAEVWKMGDNDEVSTEEDDDGPPYYFGRSENPLHRAIENLPAYIFEDFDVMAARLEGQIEEALKKLKSTQEAEYMLAKQKLYSQKDYIISLHRQQYHERCMIRAHIPIPFPDSSPYDIHLSNLVKLVHQVKREEEKFNAMLEEAAAKGS